MRRALLLTGIILALSVSARAQGASGVGGPPISAAQIYTWQVGIAVQYNRINVTGNPFNTYGFNTSLVHYVNRWVGFEGQADAGFGNTQTATIPNCLCVKTVFLGGGVRVALRTSKSRFEPWVHALGGLEHFRFPQGTPTTQNVESGTSIAGLVGVGTEFYLNPEIALRGEVDWIGTRFYSLNQRHFQSAIGVVFNF